MIVIGILSITRKEYQGVRIGTDILVSWHKNKYSPAKVNLLINAPPDVKITREEVYLENLRRQGKESDSPKGDMELVEVGPVKKVKYYNSRYGVWVWFLEGKDEKVFVVEEVQTKDESLVLKIIEPLAEQLGVPVERIRLNR